MAGYRKIGGGSTKRTAVQRTPCPTCGKLGLRHPPQEGYERMSSPPKNYLLAVCRFCKNVHDWHSIPNRPLF